MKTNWAEIEAKHGCGLDVDDSSHDAQVFKARNVQFDNRMAEALCLSESTTPLQKVRTLLERGQIHEAEAFLKVASLDISDVHESSEWLIENCRVHAFFGRWEEVLSGCQKTLSLTITPITRMTALQTRSIAYYEMGQWQLALKDIEMIRSFAKLFPESYSAFYAEILAIKIESTFGDFQKAEALLKRLWLGFLSSKTLNQDRLLTLLRVETHKLRLGKQNPLTAGVATLRLSELMGDDQYAAFARVELFCSGLTTDKILKQLKQDRESIPLVNLLLSERDSGHSTFTTSKLLNSVATQNLNEDDHRSLETLSLTTLIIPKQRAIIRLDPFHVVHVSKKSRPFEALLAILEGGEISKSDLFQKVFSQKYVSHLHDSTVYQLIRRIRQQLNVPLTVENSLICAANSLVVKI